MGSVATIVCWNCFLISRRYSSPNSALVFPGPRGLATNSLDFQPSTLTTPRNQTKCYNRVSRFAFILPWKGLDSHVLILFASSSLTHHYSCLCICGTKKVSTIQILSYNNNLVIIQESRKIHGNFWKNFKFKKLLNRDLKLWHYVFCTNEACRNLLFLWCQSCSLPLARVTCQVTQH